MCAQWEGSFIKDKGDRNKIADGILDKINEKLWEKLSFFWHIWVSITSGVTTVQILVMLATVCFPGVACLKTVTLLHKRTTAISPKLRRRKSSSKESGRRYLSRRFNHLSRRLSRRSRRTNGKGYYLDKNEKIAYANEILDKEEGIMESPDWSPISFVSQNVGINNYPEFKIDFDQCEGSVQHIMIELK
uniref:Uncharacterized protein n=1 Tax=Acrobeloides nanus TaxID=290746 RepID=A0A914DH69_9BILA